ncbi:MAG: hypothetical protein ABIB43_03875 [archaeon]
MTIFSKKDSKIVMGIGALIFAGTLYGAYRIGAARDNYLAQNPVVAEVRSLNSEFEKNKKYLGKLTSRFKVGNYSIYENQAKLDSAITAGNSIDSKIDSLKATPEYQSNFRKNEEKSNSNSFEKLKGTSLLIPGYIGGILFLLGFKDYMDIINEEKKK